jgi:TonB family protein
MPYVFIAFEPDIADYHPAASRALGEQGTASLVLCYDRDGKTAEVRLVKRSGIANIDEAAVRWASALRVSPALKNGVSKPGCVVVRAEFSPERLRESSIQREDSLALPAIIWPSLPPPPWPGRFIPLSGEVR